MSTDKASHTPWVFYNPLTMSYDMRDRARKLLGDKYAPHMAELGKILKMTAERDKKEILAVAIEVAKKHDLIGMDLMMVMAAAVELAEPSA